MTIVFGAHPVLPNKVNTVRDKASKILLILLDWLF